MALLVGVVGGDVEEAGNHVDAAVLDVGGLGVFFVVDEVLAKASTISFSASSSM